MRDRFEKVGAPGHLAATWFANVLRGGTAALRTLLERAGLGQHLEAFLSVEEAGIWKPGRGRDGSGRPDREAVLSILLRVRAYAPRLTSVMRSKEHGATGLAARMADA